MVMYRRHFKEALTVRQLEIPHLKYIGCDLADVNKARNDNYQRTAEHECHAYDHTAEVERTRIAHKHLCGVKIVHKKAHRTAYNGSGESGKLGHFL